MSDNFETEMASLVRDVFLRRSGRARESAYERVVTLIELKRDRWQRQGARGKADVAEELIASVKAMAESFPTRNVKRRTPVLRDGGVRRHVGRAQRRTGGLSVHE